MIEKLDILFLNPDPRRSAGCNISLLGVVAGLDKTRFRAHLAVPDNNEYQDTLERLGVQVVDYRANNWWYPTPSHFYYHLAGLRERVMALVSAIREREIDLVYTNAEYSFEGGLAAAIAGIPHVWAQRVQFAADLDVLKCFPLSEGALAQLMADLSDVVIGNSGVVLRSFPAAIPPDKIGLIESGLAIPHSLAPRAEAKNTLVTLAGIPPDSRIVLTVSRISPEKDLVTFVRTAARVVEQPAYMDVHFLHVGKAAVQPYRDELTKLCHDMGMENRVHFLGSVELDRINEIYRGADAFLLTSTNFEGFARTCAEAMLVEVPAIATRCGGPEDYIRDGDTGFLCDVGDVETLAQRVSWVLDNPDAGREMGVRARPWIAEHYDERILNAKWMALFEKLVSRPRIAESTRTLQIELLINVLTHIGQTGVDTHDMNLRLTQAEGLNPLARGTKSILRRLSIFMGKG